MVKKVKGFIGTNWLLQNSHRDVKCSIGKRVSHILITMYDARWILDLPG